MKGVLLGRGEYDWVLGGNAYFPDLPNVKDWKKYELEHEVQFNQQELYDELFCVTYSALKAIAKLLTFLIEHKQIPQDTLNWLQEKGYFKNGKLNFNERFTGTLGETTHQGAYQFKVADAIRKYGLIPQDAMPKGKTFEENIDKKFITEANYELGREFLKRLFINYAWTNIDDLENRPLQTIVRFANYSDPADILKPEGALNHAVVLVYEEPAYNEIEDSYYQRYKRYGKGYTHSYMTYHITINKNMDTQKFIKENDTNQVRNINTGAYGVVYQGLLMEIKPERAGLYMIDRDARGLIGKGKTVQITNDEWEQIKNDNLLVNF